MTKRVPLRDVELTGGSGKFRTFMFWGLIAVAAIGALGYVLPAHRLSHQDTFHSNFADGGPWSLVVFVVVASFAFGVRKWQFGAGLIAGMIAVFGAVLAVAPVFLVHMFSSPETAIGETLFGFGVLGLFFGGIGLLFAEPFLYLTARRRLEQAAEPSPLPEARLIV